MDERGWQKTAAARPDAWVEVLHAQRRLDRAPLRRLVKRALRAESPTLRDLDVDLVASDPLRGWRRLGDALTRDLVDPLDDYVRALDRHGIDALLDATGRIPPSGSAALDWPARADGAVRSLIDLVPDDHPDRGALAALVLTFCYLECIVFWEHTTAPDLATILRAVGRHAQTEVAPGAGTVDDRAARLLVALERACRAVSRELEVEHAWSCACPPSVTRTADRAVEALTDAAVALERPLSGTPVPASDDPALGTLLEGLEIVLAESITDAHLYFSLLHQHIGPAATEFAANLADRSGDLAVVDPLLVAIAAVDHALDESCVPHIHGVFRSEARTQRRSLAAMLEIVGGADGPAVPTLFVERGELHYLFPFGLPVDADGEDFVQKALTEHAGAGASPSVARRPRLAGCSVTIEDALQSEVFHHASVAYESGPVGAGVRLTFADHRLVLETAAGVRLAGIDVEVLLGPLNNHVVHIVVTTDVVPRRCTAGGAPAHDEPTGVSAPAADPQGDDAHGADRCGGRFERLPGGWTPHDLDQLLHRGGADFGDERLYFVDEDEAGEGDAVGDHTHPNPTWASFIELAATIVNDLHREVDQFEAEQRRAPAGEREGDTRPPAPTPPTLDVDERASLLRQQSHIVVVVTAASSVLAGERRPLPTATAVAGCRGGAALFGPQPPAPRSLEEWTSAPPVVMEDLADRPGIVANMDSQIRCHGDTTLMFVPSSPNWQIIEDQDLIVFALSLGSAYQLGRERLLASSDLAARLDSPEDLAVYGRKELDELARDVRATERRLSDQIGFADKLSGHARSAAVIRPRRDRALIDHIDAASGVDEMERAMTETRGVAADRLDDLRDMIGRIAEAQHRRGQSWVERFLLTVAVLAFVDVVWFFFDIHRDFYDGWTTYYFVVLGVLVLAAAGVAAVVFRNAPRASVDPPRGSTSSRSTMARTGIGSTAATRASRASSAGSPDDASIPSQER